MDFPTKYIDIIAKINAVDPLKYGKTRNYLNGAVTHLSPYISRGIISTQQVAQMVLQKGYKPAEIESFLKELAWRDYFQQVWLAKGNAIDDDLKQPQPNCNNWGLASAINNASTGIVAIDNGISSLKTTGYMHNHMRMYVAAMACNVAKSHWRKPAQWMYYYLLDADWASNALSWQWVAGSFSSKKYIANQENINRYCATNQTNTFLDIQYEDFETMTTPSVLTDLEDVKFETKLPENQALIVNAALPSYVYNFYNVDCNWDKDIAANRILLLEPSFFSKYPVCEKTMAFVIDLSKNIDGVQIFVGEFSELKLKLATSHVHFKEHPTAKHYVGTQHKRDWMFEEITGYFPSFFAYWKKCEKHIAKLETSR